jgi:hypothetical protein
LGKPCVKGGVCRADPWDGFGDEFENFSNFIPVFSGFTPLIPIRVGTFHFEARASAEKLDFRLDEGLSNRRSVGRVCYREIRFVYANIVGEDGSHGKGSLRKAGGKKRWPLAAVFWNNFFRKSPW